MMNKDAGYIVETKEGKVGRTYHNKNLPGHRKTNIKRKVEGRSSCNTINRIKIMIIKETRILECWCPCGAGQVAQLLQKSFEEKTNLAEFIGRKFICPNCKEENTIEDVLQMIPESFLVTSQLDVATYKAHKQNNDLKNFLES